MFTLLHNLWELIFVQSFTVALDFLTSHFAVIPPLAAVGAYGLAVIGLTLVIRLLLFPVQQFQIRAQFQAQITQRLITNKMAELRRQYKGDSPGFSRAMFAFYRENHVNPFGGLSALLPLLIQIPILIALSTVFRFEAAHAHLAAHFLFVPNLNDDPNSHLLAPFLPTPAYLVLPVAAAIASYFQAHLSVLRPGANAGKVEQVTHLTQRLTGLLLPVIIYTVAIVTPSGLGLYWLVGNCVAIAQQLIFPPKLHTPVE